MIYCEMLGHEVNFAHIHAVKMTQEMSLLEKKCGYLTCQLLLHEKHELMILLINTIQRDLKSQNWLEICTALHTVCKLISDEMVPAVLPQITALLDHNNEHVRKKSVMALHRCYLVSPEAVAEMHDIFRRALCDKDPAVMNASLCLFYDIALGNPLLLKDLVPSFVSILKQIIEHRLHRDYDYHRVPAPWLQIKLLRLMAMLGKDDQGSSEGMYEVLVETMKRADTVGINAGYAIVYECVRTIVAIYPNTQLLDAAAAAISRFIAQDNHNLKYVGVTGLSLIVQINPKYALDHQMAVLDCLEDPDDTLKRKTLDLLFKMTNGKNVVFIAEKMIEFLRSNTDDYLRQELVERITQLAERFAPSNSWYISTMNQLFELGGQFLAEETAHNMMRLIAEGTGEDEDADHELRVQAVTAYLALFEKPYIPDILIRTMSWVLGEFGYLSPSMSVDDVHSLLASLLDSHFIQPESRAWIISGMMKLCARMGQVPEEARDAIERFKYSKHVDVQQRCLEFEVLANNVSMLRVVLPKDASMEDVEVDIDLSFLDNFVGQRGGASYVPKSARQPQHSTSREAHKPSVTAVEESQQSSLRFSAYENTTPHQLQDPRNRGLFDGMSTTSGGTNTGTGAFSAAGDGINASSTSGSAAGGSDFPLGSAAGAWGTESGTAGGETASVSSSPFAKIAPGAVNPFASAAGGMWSKEGFAGGLPGGGGASTAGSSAVPSATSAMPAEAVGASSSLFAGLSLGSSTAGGSTGSERNKDKVEGGQVSRKKERMAAALFGGGGSDAGGGNGGLEGGAVKNEGGLKKKKSLADRKKEKEKEKRSEGGVVGNLLDAHSNRPPATSTSTSTAASQDLGSLLDFGGSAAPTTIMSTSQTQSSQSSSSAPVPPATGSRGPPSLMDLDDLLGLSSSSITASPGRDEPSSRGGPAPPPSNGSMPPVLPSSMALAPSAMGLASAESVTAALRGCEAQSAEWEELGGDERLQISSQKHFSPTEVILSLTLRNTSKQGLSSLSAKMEVPSDCSVRVLGEGLDSAKKNAFSMRLLSASTASHVLLALSKQTPREFPLYLSISYEVERETQYVNLQLAVNVEDFVRANRLDTPTFGSLWTNPSFSAEAKNTARNCANVRSPGDYAKQVTSTMHLHVVDSIGQEVICAGQMMTGQNPKILVHARVLSDRVEVTLKTSEKALAEALLRSLLRHISQ
jgi:AP-4 complex subunit epsilon-1